jgi:hypothetical protein
MSAEKEELERLLKQLPGNVKLAIVFAMALGLLLGIHGILNSIAAGGFAVRFIVYAVLIFFFYLANGVSFTRRS